MNFRRAVYVGLGWLLVSALAVRPLAAAPPPATLAHVHWLGLKQVGADTNSARLLAVWNLPQTAALVAQTLDKISRLPGHGATNAAAAALRPLLDDLIANETYLELCAPANPQSAIRNPQILLALRLPADRARAWQSGLPAALPTATISQSGEWTLVGLGDGAAGLLPDFAARAAALAPASFSLVTSHPSLSRPWLDADFDPSFVARIFSLSAGGEGRGEAGNPVSQLLSPISHIHLTAAGEGGNVLTRATLDFSRPFAAPLPPWEIPTNLIHQPLTGFTAVRGISDWLSGLPAWQELQLVPAPDQAFFWSQAGPPFVTLTYFAAPLPDAGNQLSRLAVRLAQDANPWLATNAQGHFQWQASPPRLVWRDALFFSPFLQPALGHQDNFVLGGLGPFLGGRPQPMPIFILRDVLDTSNLVYFQAEQTGAQIRDDLSSLQTLRLIFHKPQLPGDVGVWLDEIGPLLGDSVTMAGRAGPARLAFTRRSTVGFTALELHLFADWLASPQFPRGLHTFLAPAGKRFNRHPFHPPTQGVKQP